MNVIFEWKVPIDISSDRLWRHIADTHRLNQYAGLPKFTLEYVPEDDGGSHQIGRTRYMGMTLQWDEHPFSWIEGRYYEVVRTYHNGPLLKLHTAVTLQPIDGKTVVHQKITCTPRWFFVAPLLYWEVGFSSRRRFHAAYQKIAKALSEDSERTFIPASRTAIPPARLEAIRQRLKTSPGREWFPNLVDAIETLPDDELDAMRPFVFAQRWNAPPREVLKLFLYASRAGLLDLSWDVICPSCRGAKERHDSLKKMKTEAHCPSCNIKYDADFADSVEVCFRPNASIRRIDTSRYCSGGPMNTPRIVVQQQIPAKSSKTLELRLSPWNYLIRSHKLQNLCFAQVSPEFTESNATIRISQPILEPPMLELAPEFSLAFQNDSDKEIVMMIERLAGNEDAATASMVIAMDEFRTLFSEEVVTPKTPFSVGAVSIMFTDLKASTSLYEEIGEAPAYALVERHFDLLREQIAQCEGTVVKTIGDSVMAVFMDPAKAVEAALKMHAAIKEDNELRGHTILTLKVGIHHGPCIAVNVNAALDYFGTAVNLAARIQKESHGEDVILTEDVWSDAHVREFLDVNRLQAVQEDCTIRGLAGLKSIYRIEV